MLIQANSRLVMIGDSITDVGRARPIGQGRGDALGRGYVALVNALLTALYPERAIHVINTGIGGNQVPDLEARWQSDVLDLRPDWLSILIGINDVWRQFDCPNQPDTHVSPERYREGLDRLVGSTLPKVQGIVVMAPYMIEPNAADPMRRRMDEYGRIAKEIAAKHGARFVDTQAAFDRALTFMHPYYLAWDRIHPDTPGHMIIARAFMEGVGCDWRPE